MSEHKLTLAEALAGSTPAELAKLAAEAREAGRPDIAATAESVRAAKRWPFK